MQFEKKRKIYEDNYIENDLDIIDKNQINWYQSCLTLSYVYYPCHCEYIAMSIVEGRLANGRSRVHGKPRKYRVSEQWKYQHGRLCIQSADGGAVDSWACVSYARSDVAAVVVIVVAAAIRYLTALAQYSTRRARCGRLNRDLIRGGDSHARGVHRCAGRPITRRQWLSVSSIVRKTVSLRGMRSLFVIRCKKRSLLFI